MKYQMEIGLIAVAAMAGVCLCLFRDPPTPEIIIQQVEDHFFVVASSRDGIAVAHYPGCWCFNTKIDVAAEKADQRAYAERELGRIR